MTNRVETSEELKLAAQKNMDSEMLAAVTDANSGLMRVGALPKVSTASAAGNKALLEGIAEKAGVVSTFPKPSYLGKSRPMYDVLAEPRRSKMQNLGVPFYCRFGMLMGYKKGTPIAMDYILVC